MSRYALPADLQALSLPAAALTGVTEADQQKALDAASSLADGYLAGRYVLPLTAYGDDLKRAVCNIAAYDLLTKRGYNPDADGNSTIRDRYDDAIRWLEKIASGLVSPAGITDSSPDGSGDTHGQFVFQARPTSTGTGAFDGLFTVGVPKGRGW